MTYKETVIEYIEEYIKEVTNITNSSELSLELMNDNIADAFYPVCRRALAVLSDFLPNLEDKLSFRIQNIDSDIDIFIDSLTLLKCQLEEEAEEKNKALDKETNEKLIFLSHKSDDKKYGDALRNFIIGLGIKNEQLVYTSHELHKIPLDKNIYEYLRENINHDMFMIILWSNTYLESPACLNEMGAAWVSQSDYTNIYVPGFAFGNPKYHECAVDTRKMGAVLNGDEHCRAAMIELKNKITKLFNLTVDEKQLDFLLNQFIKEITA